MKYIQSSRDNFMLEASLQSLHEQNLEWLEDIRFWKDETTFFIKLISEVTKTGSAALNTPETHKIQKQLLGMSAHRLDELMTEVLSHERFLFHILKNEESDEQLYRSRHAIVMENFYTFEKEFRTMKKDIFQIIKTIETI